MSIFRDPLPSSPLKQVRFVKQKALEELRDIQGSQEISGFRVWAPGASVRII